MIIVNVCSLTALLLVFPCLAFVDNYKWNYGALEDSWNEVMKESTMYGEERDTLEQGYTGEKGQGCLALVKKEKVYGSARTILTSNRITIRQKDHILKLDQYCWQFKNIDQDTYTDSQQFAGDQLCVQAAYDKGMTKADVLKTDAIASIRHIKDQSLQNIRSYLDKCITQ